MYREESNTVLLEREVEAPPIQKNAFSSKTYAQTETVEPEVQKASTPKPTSSIIEKPNYDFIDELSPEEEKKVYKIEREASQQKTNTFGKKLRVALFSLVVAICSVWGIANIVSITNLQSDITAVTEEYKLNLVNYLSKLGTLDGASNYNDLFETYPAQSNAPTNISESSNWFDRICNFIGGLFGG